MNEIVDVNELAKTWAVARARRDGHEVESVDNRLELEVLDFKYTTPSPLLTPESAYSSLLRNGTSVAQTTTVSRTITFTSTFQWSLTEGIKGGLKQTFKAGVPEVAGSSTELSFELSFSATQAQTATQSKSWQITQPVVVPPRTMVKVSLMIRVAHYDCDFTARVAVHGMVDVHYRRKPGDPTVGGGDNALGVLGDVHGFVPWAPPGFEYPSDGSVAYTTRGTFKAVDGLDVDVAIDEVQPKELAASSLDGIEIIDVA